MDANITGVGIGIGIGDGESVAGSPGDPVLVVYTLEPESAGELRARLASVAGVSALADSDFPIQAVHTGVIDAQPHRMRLRPAPGTSPLPPARWAAWSAAAARRATAG